MALAFAAGLWERLIAPSPPGVVAVDVQQELRHVEETSYVLRGRLRETEQLHRHHGLPVPVEIRHDEFTVDIAENRILRGACERTADAAPPAARLR